MPKQLISFLLALALLLIQRGFDYSMVISTTLWFLALISFGFAIYFQFRPRGSLKIEVTDSFTRDWWPQKKQLLGLDSKCLVEVGARFKPKGNVSLRKLKLHIGVNVYREENLPAIKIDKEKSYSFCFKVPNWVLTDYYLSSSRIKPYIQAEIEGSDSCSENFGIGITTSV